MTSHGLVRCTPQQLLTRAAERHGSGTSRAGRVPRWRYDEPSADRSTCWDTRLPDGSVLGWCLEVEQGANGVLAHLSATVVDGRLSRLPGAVQRLALRRWTEHELAVLARGAGPRLVGARLVEARLVRVGAAGAGAARASRATARAGTSRPSAEEPTGWSGKH